MLTYTGLRDLAGSITNNSSDENKLLLDAFLNMRLGEIYGHRDWYFLYATDTTRSTVASQQFYDTPGDMGRLISTTVRFDTTDYTPRKAPTRQFWDRLNQSTKTTADAPEWFYPFAGEVGYYPKFSSVSGSITYHYKKKAIDLSIPDFTGTVEAVTSGEKDVIGGASVWTSAMAGLWIKLDKDTSSTSGDGRWYEVDLVRGGTDLVLKRPYEGNTISSASVTYTMGETSLLPENFHHLPVYGAAEMYYTSVKPEQMQAQLYKTLYTQGFQQLSREHGNVTTDVKLEDTDVPMENPNFYIRG